MENIQQRYGPRLTTPGLISRDNMPISPSPGITLDKMLQARMIEYLQPRLHHSLRAGFNRLIAMNRLVKRTPVTHDDDDTARMIPNFRPDTAYYPRHLLIRDQRVNRAPGDVRPPSRWTSGLRSHQAPAIQDQFQPALSQVNYYMKQHHSRYGYILTDLQLVAIKRLDRHDRIELSYPISWTTRGTTTSPRLTVLLGAWYLGMLAAEDQGPDQWYLNDPRWNSDRLDALTRTHSGIDCTFPILLHVCEKSSELQLSCESVVATGCMVVILLQGLICCRLRNWYDFWHMNPS